MSRAPIVPVRRGFPAGGGVVTSPLEEEHAVKRPVSDAQLGQSRRRAANPQYSLPILVPGWVNYTQGRGRCADLR
jgi:hypothetical protein